MTLRSRLALLAAVVAAAVLPAAPAAAAPSDPPSASVPQYQVKKSYQDKPEDLWEIAARFLGDANRAGEILDLNASRVQPDGGRLSDPDSLHAGWKLVLPWDAVGTDVQIGSPPANGTPSSPEGEPADGCARPTKVPSSASWGQTLLAPARVWSEANGAGVRIAVVDSGTDATSTELAGRVAAGTDVVTGAGRGDTDCLGTGTAIAGIAAGDDGAGGKQFGVAPKATIVPIRVAAHDVKLQAGTVATGIRAATATGARVITIGAGVDAADRAVRAAIDNAIAADIVVVVPAATTASAAVPGLLRVGAVANDGKPAKDYPDGSLDLVAPGVKVASVDRAGTGAQYAAGFVAGTVALLRSAHPTLRAADVTNQVLRTTTPGKTEAGMVNPYAAVATPLAAGATGLGSSGSTSVVRTVAWVLLWIVLGAAVLLLVFLGVRRLRPIRQARAERRRQLAGERDDPFWQPPADDEPTQRNEAPTLVD
jgi:membrane-anchored mycosin MYCP